MPEPVTDMRDWGLVSEAALARIVVISPHLDDAVLGCGRLLARHPGATVVTVYTGGPARYPDPMTHWDTIAGFRPGDDVLAARKREDTRALTALGATPAWLDHTEHQYLDRPDWVGADQVVDSLEEALRAVAPTAVFAPFGLANPDHAATHDAAMLVRERMLAREDPGEPAEPAWFCYEDSGYKHIPGMLAWRVSTLFRRSLWPTPAAVPLDPTDDRKLAAFACYESQVRALEADWQIGPKLAAPAAEQHWRLAPPPEGWERLATT